ncbi:hypothetical protein [Peribacillus simplex]|uniref:Lipoprotein n=1 Tax=Peribacillus simplex TaxID=1478 RepID=A0AAN2TS05_9BACI|nr:hypothetical protein [Peribacillus simplex]CEG31463.1 hypothetical protein BN1180_01607 [Peribacillus simplex]
MKKVILLALSLLFLTACGQSTQETVSEYRNEMQQSMEDIDLILAGIRGTAKEVSDNPNFIHDKDFIGVLDSTADAINKTCDTLEAVKPSEDKTVQSAQYYLNTKAVVELRYVADNYHEVYYDQEVMSSVNDAIDSALYYIDQARVTLDTVE